MSCKFFTYTAVFAAVLLCSLSVRAQSSDESSDPLTIAMEGEEVLAEEMEEVVITATSASTSKMDTSVPADVLDQDDLDDEMPTTVAEATSSTPGVSFNAPAGVYFTNPSIRGLGGRRVIILVDGRRVDTEKNTGVTGYFLNSSDIGNIEIVRGPGSVLYGSDALGGVINVITTDPLDQHGPSLGNKLRLGSNNGEIRESAYAGWGSDSFGIKLSAFKTDADNYAAGGGREIDNSFYEDQGLTIKLAAKPSRRQTLRLWGDVYDGGPLGKAADNLDDEKRRRILFPSDRHYSVSASYEIASIVPGWELMKLFAYWDLTDRHNRVNLFSTDWEEEVSKVDKESDVTTIGASLLNHIVIVDENILTLGVEGRYKRYDMRQEVLTILPTGPLAPVVTKPFDGSTMLTGGVFLRDEHRFTEQWILNAGIRWDSVHSSFEDGDGDEITATDGALSGNLGLVFHPVEQMSLTLNAGRAFRAPTLKEQFDASPACKGFLCGDPELSSETSWNLDTGLKGYAGIFTYELYGFAVFVDDYITLDAVEDELCDYEYANIGEAMLLGGEARITLDIPVYKQLLAVKITTSASYVYGEDRATGDPLAQIPPLRLVGGLRLHGGNRSRPTSYYIEGTIKYAGAQDRVSPQGSMSSDVEQATDQYALVNMSAGIANHPASIPIEIDCAVRVDNVGDTSYRDHLSSVSGMGRNIKLAVSVSY